MSTPLKASYFMELRNCYHSTGLLGLWPSTEYTGQFLQYIMRTFRPDEVPYRVVESLAMSSIVCGELMSIMKHCTSMDEAWDMLDKYQANKSYTGPEQVARSEAIDSFGTDMVLLMIALKRWAFLHIHNWRNVSYAFNHLWHIPLTLDTMNLVKRCFSEIAFGDQHHLVEINRCLDRVISKELGYYLYPEFAEIIHESPTLVRGGCLAKIPVFSSTGDKWNNSSSP